MAELTINLVIKLIVGILVLVAVVWGVYYVFNNYVGDFFKNVVSNETPIEGVLIFLK